MVKDHSESVNITNITDNNQPFFDVNITNITDNNQPFLDVSIINGNRVDFPRTFEGRAGQTSEVKLAADGWIGSTGVRDVVWVERHQVTEDVRAPFTI